MKIKDITAKIEAFAPLALQESYDNAGLIVGRYDDQLQGGVLLAVDVTDEVIDEALEKGCGMVITHHPIVFHPLKRFNSASVVERCVERAIRHNIALYACHTNLDSAPHGMSWRLGEMLGVCNMEVLEPTVESAGFGTIGTLVEPMATEQFLAQIKATLGCGAIRHSKIDRQSVHPKLMWIGDWEVVSGRELTHNLLLATNRPDAIFAQNDTMACGALQAIQEMGLRVPEDVAVVGFDNTVFCNWMQPTITSVAPPFFRMGEAAFEQAHALLCNDMPDKPSQRIPCSLCIRKSTVSE